MIKEKLLEKFNLIIKLCNESNEILDDLQKLEYYFDKQIKNSDHILLDNDKDDYIFYRDIINNSIYFFKTSLLVRKKKIYHDLNKIISVLKFDIEFTDLNIDNFEKFIDNYEELKNEFKTKINKDLEWLKPDKNILHLQSKFDVIDKEITEDLENNYKILLHLNMLLNLEKDFYTN
jgi:hypothetical protein